MVKRIPKNCKTFSISMPTGMVDKIDEIRGEIPRSIFITTATKERLKEQYGLCEGVHYE